MVDFKKLFSGFSGKRKGISFDFMRELLPGGKLLVGLDMGSSALKLVEIEQTSKGKTVSRFFHMPLEKGVIEEGVAVERQELAGKIKEIFKKSGCKRRKVVTSLSGHSVIVKKVTFPTMEDAELREFIKYEAGKYLPFDDMEEVGFDFQILGENEYNPNQMDVIIVAAKQDVIDGYTGAIEKAGYTPVIMDVDSFALETMYEENYDFDEHEMAVLVNIGASITNINVVRGGMSVFTRDFALAGNYITEAIQQAKGITFEEAEKLKIEGPDGDETEKRAFKEGLLSYADPICSEIERSIEYFRSTYGGEYIKHILLSGGTANIPGIAEEISQRVGIEAEIANPFKKIGYNPKAIDPSDIERIAPIAAVGVGLALRQVGDK